MERIQLDYTYVIGDSKNGDKFLSIADIEHIKNRIEKAHDEIQKEKNEKPELSFLELPYAYESKTTILGGKLLGYKEIINQKANLIREKFSDYVQIAIGGSSLGAMVLYNALSNKLNNRCKVHIPNDIDPEWIGEILDLIQIESTFFNIISKSGGTVETLANFFVFYNALKEKLPKQSIERLKDHFVIMTNPKKGSLLELSKNFTLIPIPDSVHGRYSVLSPGGLLTAAVAGIDIDELLDGARVMHEYTEEAEFWQNPMLVYATIHYLANTQKNIDQLILLPYSQNLRTIADWYSQMVAESLGKDGKGITPIKALGALDQHSQLQIYNDGPKNKLVTFFSIDKFRREIKIPEEFPSCIEYQYLWGHTINELIDSERKATAISLYKNGVPNCTIKIPEITPYFMGQLFMLLEKVIPILGKLYEVNAFDQPGVEESKEYARAMLGKKGKIYDDKRNEIDLYSNIDNIKMA